MAEEQQQQHTENHTASSRSDGEQLVLVARSPSWGLPTACPACLPSFLYLKLAQLDFAIHYNDRLPDSDDLPSLEYGDLVGFSGETGGIIEFLKNQSIADLDAGFLEAEVAELRPLTAMVDSCLQNALLYELWDGENAKVANRIYFSALPWPINKVLNWKQQKIVNETLGIQTINKDDKVGELYKKAAKAYESLSIILGDKKFFMKTRPSSLDALFLGHALFVLCVPLEKSQLKEELQKHANLVRYAERLQKEFLEGSCTTPIAKNVYATSRTNAGSSRQSSSTSAKRRDKEPKERSEKEKLFKRRAKYFVAAQIAAVVVYVMIFGIAFDTITMDDEDGGQDD